MREKFGRFVLLDEIETTGLGTEYRAAKLGPSGFERLVSVIRFGSSLSGSPDTAKDVLEHIKQAASLQNPYILKVHGIGKIESNYYISYEFIEARSLRTILARCRQEGFPFSANHTLLIASKVCSALDFAHSRKAEDGRRFLHGLLNPAAVLLSNDGEVRVRFFGVGRSRIREGNALRDDDKAYLAPEQRGGGPGDAASDVYSLGAILFECLTGERFFQAGRDEDVVARITAARLQDPSVEPRNIPEPVADILRRSLAENPRLRYPQIEEMRKAIDTLLFSGDFTPTTFNLAFLMHSLFREQLERETRLIKQEREASYSEFLLDEPTAPPLAPPAAADRPTPSAPPSRSYTPAPSQPLREEHPLDHTEPYGVDDLRSQAQTDVHRAEAFRTEGVHSGPIHVSVAPKRSVAGPLIAGALAVLVLGGLAAYLLLRRSAPAPTPPPLTAEMQAALSKVQELEAKLKQIEDEKAAAATKASDEAKARLEAQARQRGQAVDPLQVQRAQEAAVRKAREEQEQRAAELALELQRSQAAAAAVAAAEATPVPTPVSTPTAPLPTPTPIATAVAEVATPSVVPIVTTGTTPPPTATEVPSTVPRVAGPVVVPPTLQNAPRLNYPPLALRQRVEGLVEIRALVNEQGVVIETQVVRGVSGKSGLNEAALDNVRQRRYRPATLSGTPTRTWITVRVEFRLPR